MVVVFNRVADLPISVPLDRITQVTKLEGNPGCLISARGIPQFETSDSFQNVKYRMDLLGKGHLVKSA